MQSKPRVVVADAELAIKFPFPFWRRVISVDETHS
jgi:hypothetical protein